MAGGLFEQHGAQPQKQPKFVPLFIDKAFTGIFTQRNVLHDPSDFWTKNYGGRPDALWRGLNVELTNNLTLKRRPGLSAFSTVTWPTPPDRAFSFQLLNGTIQVIVDTTSTGQLALTSVDASIGSTAVYHGIVGGDSNAFVGLSFIITGFTNPFNNGTFVVTASSSTALTVSNANATLESTSALAVWWGGVYVDNQNGTKTLLWQKSPGAGQTYFVAVAGVLYAGDGVDTNEYTPLNSNGMLVSLWGIVPPSTPPQVLITPSGSSSIQWTGTPRTVWSTMGLIYDSTTHTTQQLQSVNASTTNATQLGISGYGGPVWNQTPGGTTADNGGTWTNRGPIVLWTANTIFNAVLQGGTALQPCIIYDPNTKSCYGNRPFVWNTRGTSGNIAPVLVPNASVAVPDGSCFWVYLGAGNAGIPETWTAGHVYPVFNAFSNDLSIASISEPASLQNGLPVSPVVYWQSSGGLTAGAGANTPPFSVTAGNITGQDGDLIWMSLGSGDWAATFSYSGWSVPGSVFSAIKDTNGNFQVCTTTGISATIEPSTSFVLSAASNGGVPVAGQTTYTGAFSPTIPLGTGVVISGFSNIANNGSFAVVTCSANQLVVNNASGVSESISAKAVYNPWGAGYGANTSDGTAVWTCAGSSMVWASNTQWYLPAVGFSPPSSSSPYGGASVIDSNSDIEFIINSGLGKATPHPTWAAIGSYTADGGSPLAVTQVTVGTGIATYTGTITGGTGNGLVGHTYLIAGFANTGNNILIEVTASTIATLVCVLTSQVNENFGAGPTATPGAIWYNLEAKQANSLSWTTGYDYAYSYKSRALTDYYSENALGANVPPIPPGLSNPLPPPTGSETGAVSTASPVYTITGGDTGAVNTVGGLYSSNVAVDTIVIWRSADGGGPANMFELTEIPNIPALAGSGKFTVNGVKVDWVFADYLPDTPKTNPNNASQPFPGLNPLIPAPINESNNPAPSAFLPMVYNFQRIWGVVGQNVLWSGGPDVLTGNPNTAFNPANSMPFLAGVTRLVKTTQGLVTFLTDSIELIAGGPATASFYSVTLAPGTGLLSYNALDQFAGEIYFFSSDNRLVLISPSLNMSNSGFPLGDQFANLPNSGVSDATWNPANVYLAILQNGIDNCLVIADGSTGWYRQNPHQVPGGAQGPEPIWSPFAGITGGCKMVQAVETSPGIKKLLVGATTANKKILCRNQSIFTDDTTPYDAWFVMGSIMLVHPGQLAVVKFLEMDFSGVSYQPTISFLLDELSGTFVPFTLNPVFDPPSLYGTTIIPKTYSPNRYYFSGTNSLARCRHMQVRVDFGTTSVGDEVYNMTIFGRLFSEQ